MLRCTHVWLTGAAILVSAGAQAADLPSRKAAPVEYVRVCSTHGTGFFYIPGTETCIRIGGRARYEFQYSQPYSRGDSTTGSRALGRIFLDARTATEFGLLRTFIRYDVSRRIGTVYSGTSARIATAFVGTGVDFNGLAQTQVVLERAFVQLGGLLAGRSSSYFGFYQGDLEFVGTTAGLSSSNDLTNLLAYTASFGGGFSATLSIESAMETRNGIVNTTSAIGLPAGVGAPAFAYAGSGVPDVVGVLRYDDAWGTAQLSGVVTQVRAVGLTPVTGVVGSAAGWAPSTEYGYALNGGLKFNLPMLAKGDQLWLQATYTKGATVYVTGNNFGLGKTTNYGYGNASGVGIADALVTGNAPGSLSLTTAWGLTAAGLHYWTPTIRQALFASYIKIDYSTAAFFAANGYTTAFNGNTQYRDWSYWTIGSNVIWSPVKDLDIGLEVNYQQNNVTGGGVFNRTVGAPANWAQTQGSLWTTRFRIQRDF
ncbi:MAG: porin, partial [Alsobacter sp.]